MITKDELYALGYYFIKDIRGGYRVTYPNGESHLFPTIKSFKEYYEQNINIK